MRNGSSPRSHVRSIETEESSGRERGNDLVNRVEECALLDSRVSLLREKKKKEQEEKKNYYSLFSSRFFTRATRSIERTELKRVLCEL